MTVKLKGENFIEPICGVFDEFEGVESYMRLVFVLLIRCSFSELIVSIVLGE
jgi:hypothetical protein